MIDSFSARFLVFFSHRLIVRKESQRYRRFQQMG
jgi:hypothetical protein